MSQRPAGPFVCVCAAISNIASATMMAATRNAIERDRNIRDLTYHDSRQAQSVGRIRDPEWIVMFLPLVVRFRIQNHIRVV